MVCVQLPVILMSNLIWYKTQWLYSFCVIRYHYYLPISNHVSIMYEKNDDVDYICKAADFSFWLV